jgi:methyl-accepting chemotaxis protein/methyl-accepting chemotaxis protein-1 (serine sensor receptor)
MTVGKRFILTAAVLGLLSTVLAIFAITGLNSIGKNVHSVATDTVPGIVYAASIRGDIYSLRADFLHHIAETDDATMQLAEQRIATEDASLTADMKAYEDAITSNEDRANFAKLQPEVAAIREGWLQVRPLSRASKNVEAFQLYRSQVEPHMNILKEQLTQLVDWNKKVSDQTLDEATHTVQSSWWWVLSVATLALVVGFGFSWWMISAVNKQLSRAIGELSEGAVQIASAATQVAASSQSMAQGASEQAATIEETSSASSEINSMAHRNTENSRTTADMVTNSQSEFANANASMQEMVVAMEDINGSSQKISKIIKVIDEIAFQTNILALNAAVEAARAGEAGMGFAVVADEVRNLAQRCAQAAKDTADLIEESINKSNGGRVKVDRVATSIRAITAESSKIKVLVDEINLGSVEQSRGIEQISRSITQMEQVTQASAANAEQGAAAAQELNAQAETLKDVVGRLRLMVQGGNSAEDRLKFAA